MGIVLIEDVENQIKQQVEVSKNLKNQVDTLIEFNANSSSYKQKEEIIQIALNIREGGFQVLDIFDWEIDPVFNQYFLVNYLLLKNCRPEVFAEKYVKENNYPRTFSPLISSQIRQQIDDHLQKRLNHFCHLYEPKVNEPQINDNVDDKKKINNSKIIFNSKPY